MKKILVFLSLLITVFLASCSLTEETTTEVKDTTINQTTSEVETTTEIVYQDLEPGELADLNVAMDNFNERLSIGL